jgi:hypothetical protein
MRIYELCKTAKNVLITTDFPFVFDRRNLYVPLTMIDVHYKQWYDDEFIDEYGILENSIDKVFEKYNEYFIVDKSNINYEIYNWNMTNE